MIKMKARKSYLCVLLSIVLIASFFAVRVYGAEREIRKDSKKTGWVLAKEGWNYLDENGQQKKSEWIDFQNRNYYVDTEGNMVTGWKEIDGERYYFREDGSQSLGWVSIENDYYYFYEEETIEHKLGSMAKNTVIDGYVIAPNGVNNQAVQQAAVLVNELDHNIAKCYNWASSLPYENNIIDDSVGSAWFAKYGYEHEMGNCYVMAATFYYCALLLGYDAHQISGYVPGEYAFGPHSWVEINMGGKTFICDPDFESETGMNGFMITNGQEDTWMYVAFHKMN